MRLSRTSINFLSTIAILAFGFPNSVLLARWLGPEGRGEVAAALLWPLLLPYLGATGMIDALVFYAARPQADLKKVLGIGVVFGTVISVLLLGLGYVLMPWLLANQTSETVAASRLMLLGIPLTLNGEFSASLLRSQLLLVSYNLQRLIVPIGSLLGSLALHFANSLTVENLVFIQILLSFLRFVVSLSLCKITGLGIGLKFDRQLARQMLIFSGKSHMGAVAENINLKLDQALIAAWLPPTQLGLYVAAVSAASLIQTLSQALKITILPQLAGQVDEASQNKLVMSMFRSYWTLSWVIAPVFSLSLIWLLPLMYGGDFSKAVIPAIILVFGSVLFGAKDVLGTSAKAIGQPWLGSKAEIAAVLMTAVLLPITIPIIGILGAAVTSVVAYALSLAITTRGLEGTRGISSAKLFKPDREVYRFKDTLILDKYSERRKDSL